MVHAHAAYLAFITHLTLANNKNNKFNSHVLQQHIWKKQTLRKREKERRIKSGHLVLTSYALQLSYHLNQIKILTSFNCDCLLIGFAFSDAPSLVALKAEEKILNFSKSPTPSWFLHTKRIKRPFFPLNILCTSTPIPFLWEPSHLWSNEYEKQKRNKI